MYYRIKKIFQLGLNLKSHYKKNFEDFLLKYNIILAENQVNFYKSKPGYENNLNIDLTFAAIYSSIKFDSPNNVVELVDDIIENLSGSFSHLFFVDGSVKQNGKVGAAIFSPSINISFQYRLPDNFSIYYAEGYAILQALLYTITHKIGNFCIISDNLKVLYDISYQSYESSPHPSLINSISNAINEISSGIVLIKWIPSISNNASSIFVDFLASSATLSPNIVPLTFSSHELSPLVEEVVWDRWFTEWRNNPRGSYQETFKPVKKYSTPFKSRQRDIIATRIRCLQSKLNSGLFKVGLLDHAKCIICDVEESNKHFIMDCKKTECLRTLIKNSSLIHPSNWNFAAITSDRRVMDIIVNFVIKNDIDI